MEYSTAKAIRQIKRHGKKPIRVDGQSICQLQAMAFAFQYHTVEINETPTEMRVTGVNKVPCIDAYLLKR